MAQPDRSHIAAQKRKQHLAMMEDVERICAQLDTDGNGLISADEFEAQMVDPESELRVFFEAGGLDLVDAELFFNMHIKPGNVVDLEDFVTGCMKLQGGVSNVDMQVIVWQIQE